MQPLSYNKIIINPEALEHNYRQIRNLVANDVKVLAMVKSDGYGHGLITSAAAFTKAGCSVFGVAEIGEGVALRESGCSGEILIFLGFEHSQIDYLFSHGLTPVLFTLTDLQRLSHAAEEKQQEIAVYLKFDCGMSRLGFNATHCQDLTNWLKQETFITLQGVMSHFPCADDRYSDNTEDVYRLFSTIADAAPVEHIEKSICNSGGTLYFQTTHGDMVRPGISLYGYYPDGAPGRDTGGKHELIPAMSFVTKILQLNEVRAGSGISYGHTYIAEQDMTLAVLPVGYSDGYFRSLSNRAQVLIGGKRVPICGRICMNLCMADVTGLQGVNAGDEAVLLGSQGNETIDADEIGSWSGTISYEVLCSFGNNNHRKTIK